MKITITDKALALMQMDMELDRLADERLALDMRVKQNAVHQMVLKRAMRDIVSLGTYELGEIGVQPMLDTRDKFEQECG